MMEAKNESNLEYFRRRHENARIQAEARTQEEQRTLHQWQVQMDGLVERFDSDLKDLLSAFAEVNLATADYHVFGPENLGHQLNWWIEYTRDPGSPKKRVLVVLRYLPGLEDSGKFTPDCFSVEGLTGVTTVKPPTVEALREALGNAGFRT